MAKRSIYADLIARDRATPTINRVKTAMIGLGAVAAAVGVTQLGRKLVHGAQAATAAAGVQEAAEVKLAQAIRLSGQSVSEVLPDLKRHASALQDLTGIGDEVILSQQAILVSMGKLRGEGLERATRAALDLAAANGMDVKAAFDLVAKAAVGYTSTLSRYGIILDESIPQSEKFAAALDKIEESFGGQAQAKLKTYEGRIEELKGRFGDLQEAIGGPLSEVTREFLGTVLSPLVDEFTDAATEADGFRRSILLSAAAVADLSASIIDLTNTPLFRAGMVFAIKTSYEFRRGMQLLTDVFGDVSEDSSQAGDRLRQFAADMRAAADAPRPEVPDLGDDIQAPEVTGVKPLKIPALLDTDESDPFSLKAMMDKARSGLLPLEIPIDLQTSDLDKALKDAGVTTTSEVRAQAEAVGIAFEQLAASGLEATNPEMYAAAKASLEGMAESIVGAGGIVPGFQSMTTELEATIGLLEAVSSARSASAAEQLEAERELLDIRMKQEIAAAGANEAAKSAIKQKYRILNDNLDAKADATALTRARKLASSLGQLEGAIFGESKAAAVAMAIINVYEGMTKAMAQGGIAGFGMAAAVLAQGMATVAQIKSTKYAKGGIVGERDGMFVTGGIPGRDSVPIMAMPGEAVLPKNLTDMLMEAARTGGTGDTYNVTIQALDSDSFDTALRRNPEGLVKAIRYASRRGML